MKRFLTACADLPSLARTGLVALTCALHTPAAAQEGPHWQSAAPYADRFGEGALTARYLSAGTNPSEMFSAWLKPVDGMPAALIIPGHDFEDELLILRFAGDYAAIALDKELTVACHTALGTTAAEDHFGLTDLQASDEVMLPCRRERAFRSSLIGFTFIVDTSDTGEEDPMETVVAFGMTDSNATSARHLASAQAGSHCSFSTGTKPLDERFEMCVSCHESMIDIASGVPGAICHSESPGAGEKPLIVLDASVDWQLFLTSWEKQRHETGEEPRLMVEIRRRSGATFRYHIGSTGLLQALYTSRD